MYIYHHISLISLYKDQCILSPYLSQFFLECEIFYKNFVYKPKHIFYVQKLFFQKSFHLWDDAVKFGGGRQVTDENIKDACLLHTE